MAGWHVWGNHATAGFRYGTSPGFGHSLLGPIAAGVFRALRISASIEHEFWWALSDEPSVASFEMEHGVDAERGAYNAGRLAEARKLRATVRGEHAGYHDLFVPILSGGEVVGTLVTGPFALARPSAASTLARWRWLTGRQGHPADPEFSAYLATVLSTLVLDGRAARMFTEMVECIAGLLSGDGRADELANRADSLRVKLERLRDIEREWKAVHEMLDDRSTRTWQSAARRYGLGRLGLRRLPDRATVALFASRAEGRDPVDDAIRRDALQRAAVGLARRRGDTIAGRVGDHGVVFLSAETGRRRNGSRDLAEAADVLARTYDLTVHCGTSVASGTALSRTFHAALGAAESALLAGARLIDGQPDAPMPTRPLGELRRGLAKGADEQPGRLAARCERFLEAVALASGYRIDQARMHLEAGFETLADALRSGGRLDAKSHRDSLESLERAASSARTLQDLLSSYRGAFADLSDAVTRPVEARQDRALRRAVEFVDQHYAENLSGSRVAKAAGFAPAYFSRLWHERQGVTFTEYLSHLRIERARHLLSGTDLSATRIAELCGFRSSQYFTRAFRRSVGTTPLGYRRNPSSKPSTKRK